MSKRLRRAVEYSKDRIPISDISVDTYVTTDNLLQNKKGKVKASGLPKGNGAVTKFKKGDILIANIRPYLKKIWHASHDGGSSADVLTLKVNEDYDSSFIFYSLFRDDFFDYVMKGSKGTKMPRGDKKQVLDFIIPDFKKNEQKAISKVLSDLDSKISLNDRINRELEAMAKLIYDYWFVQFDFPYSPPSEGSPQEGVGIGKPYKSSGGKMVYNEELKREIPEGWEVKELGEVSSIKAGGDKPKVLSSIKTETCKIPIYSNGLENEGLYGFTDQAKFFKPSITVTGRGANVGHSVLRTRPFLPIIRLLVITPEHSSHSRFLYERIKELNFQNSGSAQPQITVPQISSLKVLMPNSGLTRKYDEVTSSGVLVVENNKEQNQKLSELRDWLLPMLMNGQVTVGEGKLSESGYSGLKDDQDLNIAAEERGEYGA